MAKSPQEIYSKEELTDDSVFADDYIKMFENFAAYIQGTEAPVAGVNDGLAQVRLANAIQLSGWTGREIELPCDTEEYNKWLEQKMQQE